MVTHPLMTASQPLPQPVSKPTRARPAKPAACGTPGCNQPRAEGSFMCAEHRDRLAQFVALDEQQRAGSSNRLANRLRYRKPAKPKRGPSCTTVGCENARPVGADHCPSCEAAALAEDDE